MIKRYFIVRKEDLGVPSCEYHWIDLGSHGTSGSGYVVVVLSDSTHPVPNTWEELPHLLDGQTSTSHPKLADLGVVNMNGFQVAKRLSQIHPKFHP